MKKALLFSIIMLSTLAAIAYETVIIHFPDGEVWEPAYYRKVRNEAILQYVPKGQTANNWRRTIIIHSYNNSGFSASYFAQNEMRRMRRINPNGKYRTIKLRENDTMFTRCTEKYNNHLPQCEFLRVSEAHGGIITMQYINRNKKDFENNYTLWLETIRSARFMNSYYRDERTFDKSMYFEL